MPRAAALLICLLLPLSAWADRIRVLVPVQSDFRAMTEDLTAALSFKPLNPAEPLGTLGLHVGALASYTGIENRGAWRRSTGDGFADLKLLGASAGKGLPLGLDLGAFYAEVVDTNAALWGLELRYALADGGLLSPAAGLRASYTQATGIDDFAFSSYALDLSVSKGFALATPYVGVGRVWGRAEPDSGSALAAEEARNNKLYAGVRVNLLLVTVVAEVDTIGENTSYNLRAGFAF